MKKIILLILVLLQACFITACSNTDDVAEVEVQFFNINDKKVTLNAGYEYNLLAGITVYEGIVNKTDDLTYDIIDKDSNVYNVISLSFNNIYTVTYIYVDSTGKKHTQSCTITVGRQETDYDYESISYELFWSDEFNGNSLNQEYWTYETGTGSWGWGNNELQYYTNREKNVEVSDGSLKIHAINESYLGSSYTSGRLKTQSKVSFTYGYIEAKIKVPAARGSWSAFWLLAENNSWPKTGEIDIMEHVGYDPGNFHANTHTDYASGGNNNGLGGSTKVNNFEDEYHTYGVEWLPDKLNFYIDDVLYYSYAPLDRGFDIDNNDYWPFYNDFFIILNVAVGGNWGGIYGVDDTAFPCTMEIDYVRVYQSPEINQLMSL